MSEDPGRLAIAWNDFAPGDRVLLSGRYAYAKDHTFEPGHNGTDVGKAVESIRSGFAVMIRDGKVREDDA